MHESSELFTDSGADLNDLIIDKLPVLRVGFISHSDSFRFKLSGKFSVINEQGEVILKSVAIQNKWCAQVVNFQQAQYEYQILIDKFYDQNAALEYEYKLLGKGIGAEVKILGARYHRQGKIVGNTTEYWVIVDKLNSETEARKLADERLGGLNYKIIKQKLSEPHAVLELFDNEFEKLGRAENVLNIIPDEAQTVTTLYNINYRDELRNLSFNRALLQGPIEFRCIDDGGICAICQINLEKYIENVTGLQTFSELPLESVKALAVTLRSKVLTILCVKHADDPFDLCAGNHCIPFVGDLDIEPTIAEAVKHTSGEILKNAGRITKTNFTLICGGHTESCQNGFNYKNKYIAPPVFDGDDLTKFKIYDDLTQTDNLKKWIRKEPDVFCNLSDVKNIRIPNFLKTLFRWRRMYDREYLEEFIEKKVHTKIGNIFEIIPVKRGISGRLKEIEILASESNLVIKGDKKICEMLSEDQLPSSCFIIETQMDDTGVPISFTFHGAGVGHGIGLCQSGSIAMALQGADYWKILQHYFKDSIIEMIYEV